MTKWLVCLLVGIVTAGAGADEAKPWEAWTPPAATLPQPNGFDAYLQAFDLKLKIDEQFHLTQPAPAGLPPDPWGEGPPELPLPDRVGQYADVLKLVRLAQTQECCLLPPTSAAEMMPYLAAFRSVVRLLAMEAEVHRLDNDYPAAASSALDGLRVGRDAASQRILISYLVGAACEAIALKSLDETIPGLKAEECRQVLARLLEAESKRLPITETLTGEENFARICFKELTSSAEQQQALLKDLQQTPEEQKKLLASLSLKGWEAIGQAYAGFRQVAALPYARQPRPMPRPEDPLMQVITPVIDRVFFKEAQALTALHLREAELAARAFLLEKGKLPQDLAALTPNYLPQVLTDPFGEGALRAKLADGKLTVYSLGPDGVDDGGKAITDRIVQPESKGDVIVVIAAP